MSEPKEVVLDDKARKKMLAMMLLTFVVVFSIACGTAFYFIIGVSKAEGIPVVECQFKLDAAKSAILAYAGDHDGQLPHAESWQDDIQPYLEIGIKQAKKLHANASASMDEAVWVCTFPKSNRETGIAFNSNLSDTKLSEIDNPEETALVMEVPTPEHNAHQPYEELSPDKAPRMMGQTRHWMVAPIEGEIWFEIKQTTRT